MFYENPGTQNRSMYISEEEKVEAEKKIISVVCFY